LCIVSFPGLRAGLLELYLGLDLCEWFRYLGIEQGSVDSCAGPAYPVPLQRSKTTLAVADTRPQGFVDLERQARCDAERAMKVHDLGSVMSV